LGVERILVRAVEKRATEAVPEDGRLRCKARDRRGHKFSLAVNLVPEEDQKLVVRTAQILCDDVRLLAMRNEERGAKGLGDESRADQSDAMEGMRRGGADGKDDRRRQPEPELSPRHSDHRSATAPQ